MNKYISLPYIIFLTLFILCITNGAVMHSHLNKEREDDGAYSPRDKSHHSSGEHHNEFDHEAIIGSTKEAEEFDNLTPMESKRRLGILLSKMDLNNDKEIDKNELTAWILRSFKTLSEEEAKERLEDVDENNDGKVTWSEYISDTYGSEDSEMELDNTEMIEEDKIMWKAADWNNDNILHGEEWIAFSHPEEHPKMLNVILYQTLKDKDIDHDNSISFQEYIGDRSNDKKGEWLHAEKDKFDHELDKNGDGKLTGNEILSWVVPSNQEIAEEEVDHLFASSDDDHNNILQFSEIIDHYDIFVGSEATDYGDHLNNIHHFEDEL